MILGVAVIIYFAFGVWSIWISKKRAPKSLMQRIGLSVLALALIMLVSSISFSAKTSFHINSFPLHLDREYVEMIEVDDYAIVVYTDDDGESYGFETFSKFFITYLEYTSKNTETLVFKGEDATQLFWFTYINVNNQDYVLLFNEDLADYQSLTIEEQVIDLDVDSSSKYSLIALESDIESIETVTLNNIEYNLVEIK